MKKGQRSSLLELFNSLNNPTPSDPPKTTEDPRKLPQNSSISTVPRLIGKRFPDDFDNTFDENSEDFLKRRAAESLEVRKTFDGLEKWTNNLEQRKSIVSFSL